MGIYCDYEDIVNRYKRVVDVGDSALVEDSYLLPAEAELNARLGVAYTVPFSNNNVTAKDLAIDLTYLKVIQYKEIDRADRMMNLLDKRFNALLDGSHQMITTSGDVISPTTQLGAFGSTTEDYHPVFGMDDPEYLRVSSAQLEDEEDAR